MATIFYLTPGNDFLATFFIEAPDPTTFAKVPVTSGAISAFIAITNGPTATTAHANLVATVTHVGVVAPVPDGDYPLGTWSVTIDGAGMTFAILDPLFGPTSGNTPYLIVDRVGDVRRYQKLTYKAQLAAANG